MFCYKFSMPLRIFLVNLFHSLDHDLIAIALHGYFGYFMIKGINGDGNVDDKDS